MVMREHAPPNNTGLSGLELSGINLSNAKLANTDLSRTVLVNANLAKADLRAANLAGSTLTHADLRNANLSRATLTGAMLRWAKLSGAKLGAAILHMADLSGIEGSGVRLEQTDLSFCNLVQANLTNADLTGAHVYGVAAWNVNLKDAVQRNLSITRTNEPSITVDDLQIAQFLYLILNNRNVRTVIDTLTTKIVLLLGRFTPKRKRVLDALRQGLRQHDYVPILFDFDRPVSRDFTETVVTLAHMARFIIADLTDPASLPKELEAIVPRLAVPVQPLIEKAARPYAMFNDYWKYEWVLSVHRYSSVSALLSTLNAQVIQPAEAKARQLALRRAESLARI